MFADEKSLINRKLTPGSDDYAVRPASLKPPGTTDIADRGSTHHSGIRLSDAPLKPGDQSGTDLCNGIAKEEVIL